ncbi:MAG: alpha-1,4-glucan--maltose-1-phosphate maltosyltransferase [Spirochaeta sp.]|nr:alpha-1,4-glucan--maltose-1-phosphate maltosyltransferase [Spirochaeta sp.]
MKQKSIHAYHGRRRVVIDRVRPEIDAGAFPIKRVIGETVHVEADIIADGHDHIRAVLRYRPAGGRWAETPLHNQGNDRWTASFSVKKLGFYEYTVHAWIDHVDTWIHGLRKKHAAAVVDEVDLSIGARLIADTAERVRSAGASHTAEARRLAEIAAGLEVPTDSVDHRVGTVLAPATIALLDAWPDRSLENSYATTLRVQVDRRRAAFSAWYELFPRSAGSGTTHGTFHDVAARLPYIARLGFDIVYMPPIHPIGTTKRKGRNNSVTAAPGDPGSPWAIGSAEGGHTAIHPQLGTLEDFRELVERVRSYEMEIALDIAFQCAPDHPWVAEHPDWFVSRPDGSIQFAENPPKKYEDIYPINFETEDWQALWQELKDVFLYWIEQGVLVFRVDNPHTKAFPFWEWAIAEIRREHPEAIFLAEAFTRPKRMYRLAKAGFTQSYTYFTWRNDPAELREYLTELTTTEVAEFFRPNFWPNTPDILHEDLQTGGRAAFIARFVLAATLSGNYGIYGPAFELLEHTPSRPGGEDYLHSEKYEIRVWDLARTDSLAPLIRQVNAIRRENEALQDNRTLRFHPCDNPSILCYSKRSASGDNVILICVNMDFHATQAGMVEFSPLAVGLPDQPPFVVRDLLDKATYTWRGYWNYVELDPRTRPVHIFVLER